MNLPEPTERRAEWGLLLIFAALSFFIVVVCLGVDNS